MKNIPILFLTIICLVSFSNIEAGDPKFTQQTGFIENCGQISNQTGADNPDVKYLWSSAKALNVHVKTDGLSYDAYRRLNGIEMAFHRLDMTLVGASKSANIHATHFLEGETHHFNKHTGQRFEHIQTADELLVENIYPGIDWKLKLTEAGTLKYDFIVKKGAKMEQIKIAYQGFDDFELCDGQLQFRISGRTITEHIPASWIDETGQEVEVNYQIDQENPSKILIRFERDDKAPTDGTLVIDPEALFAWGTYYGDSLYDVAEAVAVDSLGNVFVTGTTQSYSSMASEGSHQGTFAGGDTDAFLVKFNQHGLRHWASYYGGAGNDQGLAIDMDNYRTAYIVGITTSDTLVRSDSTYQVIAGGAEDGFIASFDRDGILLWDTYIGGAGMDAATGVIADNRGNAYVCGYTDTPGFLGTDSIAPTLPASGGIDGFLARFDATGQLNWCSYMGGNGDDYLTAITLDSAYSAYAAGYSNSAGGLALGDAFQPDFGGGEDGLIAKVDSSLNFQWITYFGGPGMDRAYGVTSTLDQAFVVGSTDSGFTLSDTLAFQDTLGGGLDAYFLALNTDGSLANFSYLGGEGDDEALDVCHDYAGNLYLTGYTRSDSAMASQDAAQASLQGDQDGFVAKFSPLGERIWGTYHGGEGIEYSSGIAVLGYTAVFPVGRTTSTQGMTMASEYEGIHQPTLTLGGTDGFIGRFTQTISTPPMCCGDNCDDTGGSGNGGSGGGYGGGGSNPPQPIGICIGDSIRLSVGGGCLGVGAQWVWYADSCGGTDNFLKDGSFVWVSPVVTSTFFVRAESVHDISGCASVTVHVDYPPTAVASVNDSICPGESLEFFAEGALTYEWSGPNEFISTAQNPIIDSTTSAAAGDYQVIAITQFGCRDTAEVSAFLFDAPQFSLSPSPASCFGGSDGTVTYTTSDSTIIDFYWVEFPSDSSYTISQLAAGTYSGIATNTAGCQALAAAEVTEPKALIDSLLVFPAYCDRPNGGIQLYASGGAQPYTANWTPGDSPGMLLLDVPTGSYTLSLSDAEGCTDTAVGFIPNLGFFTTVIEADTMVLEYLAVGAIDFYTTPDVNVAVHHWSPPEAVSCVNCPSPDIDPQASVMMQLELTSDRGCFSRDSIYVVRILPDPVAFVPNRFSPNGDGLNDQLCVEGFRMLSFNLELFDRSGASVFQSNDSAKCWDGMKSGQPINGPLLYTFEAILEEGQTVSETGQIVILR